MSDESTCAQALAAFQGDSALSAVDVGEVYLFTAGSRFLVSHPEVRAGEHAINLVLDSAFARVGLFLK